MWPRLTPQQLLHDLFGARPLLALAGRNVLDTDEIALLYRPRSPAVEEVGWTDADVALLDEARAVLGPMRHRPSGNGPDEVRSYGHIVVDEAQDLSPMQLRMLARRSLSGSMTVVGDIAQATGHWAPSSWQDVLAHLPTRRGSRVTELTVNYRTPLEIMNLAARVLAVTAPALRPPDSVRASGDEPVILTAGTNGSGAAATAARAVQAELGGVGDGTVAVIVPASLHADVAAALTAAEVDFGDASRRGLDAQVTLVPIGVVKGLEFDGVVVVEPARIVAESAQGLGALYVALTRATQRLTVIHAEPLPPALARTR
jgi:DNA helicase IV